MEEKEFLKQVFEGKISIIQKQVKKHGTSGAVYLPRKLVGKTISVLIENENEGANTTGGT